MATYDRGFGQGPYVGNHDYGWEARQAEMAPRYAPRPSAGHAPAYGHGHGYSQAHGHSHGHPPGYAPAHTAPQPEMTPHAAASTLRAPPPVSHHAPHHAPHYDTGHYPQAQPRAAHPGYRPEPPVSPQAASPAYGHEPAGHYARNDYAHHASEDEGWSDAHQHANHGQQPPQQGGGIAGTATALTNFIGAALSLALIGGLGVWGYKLLVRDVSGVPVVAALEGPMRVAPEEPGGVTAAHQGLAVNAIAAEGEAEPPAERLVLAPRPTELTDEDRPAAELQQAEAEALDEEAPQEAAAEDTTEPGEGSDPVAVALALAEAVAADAEPLEGEETTEVAGVEIPRGGLTRSPFPQPRPSALREAAAQAVDASASASASAGAGTPEVDPSTIAAGTKLVQFGAYDSADRARAEWDKLAAAFDDLMGDKARVVQEARSGGKTFYRLRAMGFDDLADARRFCAALVAKEAGCIPAVAR